MIGQMNEGHDDPVSGLEYRNGMVAVNDSPGLGVQFDAARANLLQEFNDARC